MNGDDIREHFKPERKLENLMMIMHYSIDFLYQCVFVSNMRFIS